VSAVPIYEYRCETCGKTFEYMQRISDPPVAECEECGGSLERLISQSAFVLKGSGWYKDLYASPKPKDGGDAKKESGTESPGGTGTGTGAETKTGTGTGSKTGTETKTGTGTGTKSGSGSKGSDG
jgi:putative FmdB family regulatory protein